MKLSIFSLMMMAILALSACQKSDLKKEDDKKDEIFSDKAVCFELLYPVTYTMPDGTTVMGNDEEEVWTAIKAWYEAHPDVAAKPTLQYPVDILWPDGTSQPVAGEEEMIDLKKDCDSDELKVCEWDGSKVANADAWEEYVIEPLVTADDCGGCIVAGEIKYVKAGTDFAYVIYYGKGECDEWAYLATYYGSTSDKKSEKCKFKLDCEAGN